MNYSGIYIHDCAQTSYKLGDVSCRFQYLLYEGIHFCHVQFTHLLCHSTLCVRNFSLLCITSPFVPALFANPYLNFICVFPGIARTPKIATWNNTIQKMLVHGNLFAQDMSEAMLTVAQFEYTHQGKEMRYIFEIS